MILRLGAWASLAVSLLVWAGPVAAQSPSDRAAYGPLTLCLAGYAFRVRADEAVTLIHSAEGDVRGFIVLSDKFYRLHASPEAPRPDGRKVRSSRLRIAGLGNVWKHAYSSQGYFSPGVPGEGVWSTERAHREYVLPALPGSPGLRIVSEQFYGRGDDRALLARFSRRDAGTACDAVPDDPDRQRTIEAYEWSPVRTRGPAYLCQGALGFALLEGEEAQHSWRMDRRDALRWRVRGQGFEASVGGYRDPRARGKPTGWLLAIGYSVVRNAGVGATLQPPPSYPRDPADNGVVSVRASGLDEAALNVFLRRLEYRPPGARRCAEAGNPPR